MEILKSNCGDSGRIKRMVLLQSVLQNSKGKRVMENGSGESVAEAYADGSGAGRTSGPLLHRLGRGRHGLNRRISH